MKTNRIQGLDLLPSFHKTRLLHFICLFFKKPRKPYFAVNNLLHKILWWGDLPSIEYTHHPDRLTQSWILPPLPPHFSRFRGLQNTTFSLWNLEWWWIPMDIFSASTGTHLTFQRSQPGDPINIPVLHFNFLSFLVHVWFHQKMFLVHLFFHQMNSLMHVWLA